MKPLKILIIGAGMYVCGRGTDSFGTILPSIYQAHKNGCKIESVTICATTTSSIKILKKKNIALKNILKSTIPFYYFPEDEDSENVYKHVLKKVTDFDCAIISVPDHLHFNIIKSVLKSKIHVLTVKPFVTTINEAIELIDLLNNYNLYGAVEFHKRFDSANLKMRDLIKLGSIGDLICFIVEYSQRKMIPETIFKKWVEQTNVFQYLGVHYVDLIYYLTGAIPVRVMAYGKKKYLVSKGLNTYDSIQTTIEWKTNDDLFLSSHFTSWIDSNNSTAMSNQNIKAIGTLGRIESDQKNRGLKILTDKCGVEDINPYFSQLFGNDKSGITYTGYGFTSICQFLVDIQEIISGEDPKFMTKKERSSFQSAIISTAVIEAAKLSLDRSNSWTQINIDLLNKYL